MQVCHSVAIASARFPLGYVVPLMVLPFSSLSLTMSKNPYVITDRRLDQILQVFPIQIDTKSGTNPAAQTATQCEPGSRPDRYLQAIATAIPQIEKESKRLAQLVHFMMATGCRINEALRLSWKDCTLTGHVNITGSKGSNNRLASSGLASEYISNCCRIRVDPFKDFNRFQVYRLFKKYGISYRFSGSTKNSVTHIFRHALAKSIEKAGMKRGVSKLALGHKSEKSTAYYHESE